MTKAQNRQGEIKGNNRFLNQFHAFSQRLFCVRLVVVDCLARDHVTRISRQVRVTSSMTSYKILPLRVTTASVTAICVSSRKAGGPLNAALRRHHHLHLLPASVANVSGTNTATFSDDFCATPTPEVSRLQTSSSPRNMQSHLTIAFYHRHRREIICKSPIMWIFFVYCCLLLYCLYCCLFILYLPFF